MFCSVKPGCPIGWRAVCYLFFKLRELARQLRHETDSGVQSLVQRSDLVLFAISLRAHQRHGPHPGKPVQILLLKGRESCECCFPTTVLQRNRFTHLHYHLKMWVSKSFLGSLEPSIHNRIQNKKDQFPQKY